jgi:hypothetical protein
MLLGELTRDMDKKREPTPKNQGVWESMISCKLPSLRKH